MGPSRNEGKPKDDVFVIDGVTLAMVSETERIIVAGAHEIEEDGFVAGLRQTPADGVIALIDRIDDGARTQQAGETSAGKQRTEPHRHPQRTHRFFFFHISALVNLARQFHRERERWGCRGHGSRQALSRHAGRDSGRVRNTVCHSSRSAIITSDVFSMRSASRAKIGGSSASILSMAASRFAVRAGLLEPPS